MDQTQSSQSVPPDSSRSQHKPQKWITKPLISIPREFTPGRGDQSKGSKARDDSASYTSPSVSPRKSEKPRTNKVQDKYYCIWGGNGYHILKDAFRKMRGWHELPKDLAFSGKCNFIWKPTNFNYKMYCQIDQLLHRGLLAMEQQNYINLKNAENGIQAQEFDVGKELVVNHLENNREITTKTGLIRSLKAYYKDNIEAIENSYQLFDTTPTSFVVSSNLDTYEYHQFTKRFSDLKKNFGDIFWEKVPPKHCKENMWLVKPANENQGKGIKIFNDLDQIIRFLDTRVSYSYWVVQKYLEKPLLYKSRKFDIRIWAAALSNQDYFFCNKGYIRTSSAEYNINMGDEYVHLTNNCLQMKDEKNYGKHEQGNVVSFEEFQEYLDKEFRQYNLDFERDFLRRMKDLAIDCYLSAKNTMNPSKRRNCFELFGFDFMIDEDFRIWLIEVNTNPYIGIHNTKMKDLLPEMLGGFYKIVLNPVFENLAPEEEENIWVDTCWDLLYSRNRGINKRREIMAGMYPIEELSQKREVPKRFKRQQLKIREATEFDSPWELEKKKQKEFLQARKKQLQEIGENANGKPGQRRRTYEFLLQQRLSQSKSATVLIHRTPRSGTIDHNLEDQIQEDQSDKEQSQSVNQDSPSKLDTLGNDQKQQTLRKSVSPMSVRGNTSRIDSQKNGISVTRNTIANQMKYKNQPNFIPQPKLNMNAIAKNNKLQRQISLGQIINENETTTMGLKKSRSTRQIETTSSIIPKNKYDSQKSHSENGDDHDDEYFEMSQGGRGTPTSVQNLQSDEKDKYKQLNFRPEKTIVAEVTKLDSRSKYYKQKTLQIMTRIMSTMTSWELFSDDQIQDANKALKMLQQTLIYNPEDQKPIIRSLIRLVGSNEVPLHIRFQIAVNVYLMFKNKQFMRLFVQDPIEAHTTLQPIYKTLQESCIIEEEYTNNENMLELYYECINILTLILSLNSGRYHIPGESLEKNKLRQKAIDAGILVIVVYMQIETNNENLKKYILEEFFEKIDEQDFEYHFKKNHSHYATANDIIPDATHRQKIDEMMYDRWQFIQKTRLRDQKLAVELRKKEKQKQEELFKQQLDAQLERRKLAESKMELRIKALQKIQLENQEKERQQKLEQDKHNEKMKVIYEEEFKKKQENRRVKEKKEVEKKIKQERELIEEIQRQNKNREFAKKLALEKWHRQKREEDKKRREEGKIRIKSERRFPMIEFANDKFKQYDPKFKKVKNAIAMMTKKFDPQSQEQHALAAKDWLRKYNKSGSKHFSINDFVIASALNNPNFDELEALYNETEKNAFTEMPSIAQPDPSAFMSDFQKAFSAKKNKDFLYNNSSNIAAENEQQQLHFQDLQNQINHINKAIEAHYQEHGPKKHIKSISETPKLEKSEAMKKKKVSCIVTDQAHDHVIDQPKTGFQSPHSNKEFMRNLETNINSGTFLPDINNESSLGAGNGVIIQPANITIINEFINDDHSQINYNNYYMSKQNQYKRKYDQKYEDKVTQRIYVRDIASQRMTPATVRNLKNQKSQDGELRSSSLGGSSHIAQPQWFSSANNTKLKRKAIAGASALLSYNQTNPEGIKKEDLEEDMNQRIQNKSHLNSNIQKTKNSTIAAPVAKLNEDSQTHASFVDTVSVKNESLAKKGHASTLNSTKASQIAQQTQNIVGVEKLKQKIIDNTRNQYAKNEHGFSAIVQQNVGLPKDKFINLIDPKESRNYLSSKNKSNAAASTTPNAFHNSDMQASGSRKTTNQSPKDSMLSHQDNPAPGIYQTAAMVLKQSLNSNYTQSNKNSGKKNVLVDQSQLLKTQYKELQNQYKQNNNPYLNIRGGRSDIKKFLDDSISFSHAARLAQIDSPQALLASSKFADNKANRNKPQRSTLSPTAGKAMPTYRTENISPANERAALIEETAEGSNTYDAGACPKSGDAGAK